MEEKSIYELKIHESIYINEITTDIIRVPGGWIYRAWDLDKDQPVGSGTFVPFNNEFQNELKIK